MKDNSIQKPFFRNNTNSLLLVDNDDPKLNDKLCELDWNFLSWITT